MAIQILLPALSPTMTEGKLAKWHKHEGDSVTAGNIIAEVETDKATVEIEAVDEGTIGRILVAAGDASIPVNTPIAVLLEDGEDIGAVDAVLQEPVPVAIKSPPPPTSKTPTLPHTLPHALPHPPAGRVFASPMARRMAKERGLDLSHIQGSGPHGRIIRRDVENAPAIRTPTSSAPTTSPVAADGGRVEALSSMRRVIAERMSQSWQTIPHFFLSVDTELDALLALRKQINDAAQDGLKISVNDFIIRAAALSMKAVPEANALWRDDAIAYYDDADVAVAVAIEGGLITPVVRRAHQKGLRTISAEVKDLATRARTGKLMPEEYQGGTMTLSNLGMYGIGNFSAIINPPQACILAVGVAEQRPVVKDSALGIATVMSCTLSVDHRVIDGAVGAEWLKAFKGYMENPLTILV